MLFEGKSGVGWGLIRFRIAHEVFFDTLVSQVFLSHFEAAIVMPCDLDAKEFCKGTIYHYS